MRLILMRHGAAAEAGSDDIRPLTDKGKSEVERVTRALESDGIRIDRVVHSPKTRALQTAEIVSSRLGGSLVSDDNVKPGSDPDVIVAELQEWSGTVAIVSHLPYLPSLLQALTGESHSFQTASAFVLEEEGTGWKIAHETGPWI